MIDFAPFVTSLGPHAKNYTPEELRQLHVDVLTFARILLEVHRARKRRKRRSPQAGLDDAEHDRTLETE